MSGKPEGCEPCPLFLAEGPVWGQGPKPAKLMAIAESPGKTELTWCKSCWKPQANVGDLTWYETHLESEVKQHIEIRTYLAANNCITRSHPVGATLVGTTGKITRKMIFDAGGQPREIYFTNTVKCRPPGDGEVPQEAVTYCDRFLKQEIREVGPNALLLIGGVALNAFSEGKITKWQGSVIALPESLGVRKAVPILHPAGLMKSASHHGSNQQLAFATQTGWIKKALELSKTRDPVELHEDFNIFPTLEEVNRFVDEIGEEAAIDIETTTEDALDRASVICVGIYDPGRDRALCLPFLKRGGAPYWTGEGDERGAIEALIRLGQRCRLTAQNGTFDFGVLETAAFPRFNYSFDTLVAHLVYNAELPHRLTFLASQYTNYPYWKDEVKGHASFLNIDDTRLRTYNCRDARATWLSKLGIEQDLRMEYVSRDGHPRDEVEAVLGEKVRVSKIDLYTRVCVPMHRILVEMEKWGILVDPEMREEWRNVMENKIREKLQFLESELWSGFNYNAPVDVRRALYDKLELPVLARTEKTQEPSTDEDTLQQLKLLAPDSKVFDAILDCRHAHKMRSTYIDGLAGDALSPDGRCRVTWKFGPVTLRLASSPNLQNVHIECEMCGMYGRRMFHAAPGFKFVHRDYSQIEFRIIAILAQDQPWLDAFKEYDRRTAIANKELKRGVSQADEARLDRWVRESDIHTINTMDMYRCSFEEVTRERRFRAKIFIYGFFYGGSIEGILAAGGRGLSRGTAQLDYLRSLVDNLLSRHPALLAWRKKVADEVQSTREITSPLGMHWYFFGAKNEIKRQAWDRLPQGTAALIVNMNGMRDVWGAGLDELNQQGHGAFVVQVHDALMAEVREEYAEELNLMMDREFSKPLWINGEEWVFPSKGGIGDRWSEFL